MELASFDFIVDFIVLQKSVPNHSEKWNKSTDKHISHIFYFNNFFLGRLGKQYLSLSFCFEIFIKKYIELSLFIYLNWEHCLGIISTGHRFIYLFFLLILFSDFERATFGISYQGRLTLLISGHIYIKHRVFGEYTHWRCSRQLKSRCRAKAKTHHKNGIDVIIIRNEMHNHT